MRKTVYKQNIIDVVIFLYFCIILFLLLNYASGVEFFCFFPYQSSCILDEVFQQQKSFFLFLISLGISSFFLIQKTKNFVITTSSVLIILGVIGFIKTDDFYSSQLSKISISEICSNNNSIETDEEVVENRDYQDYIEFFNDSDYAINLNNYKLLIDNCKEVYLGNSIIQPHSYLVQKADREGVFKDAINTGLNSYGGVFSLISPTGKMLEEVSVPKLEADIVFAKVEKKKLNG